MVNARIIPGLAQECRCISKYVQYHIIRIETWWEIAMPYAPEHKQRTRGRIVEAASRLFKTHGYEGVGIDRIMAEAGLTRGGFYAHFEGKEALFAEVVGWLGPSARMRKRFSAEKGASGDSVLAFVRTYLSHAHRRDLANGCPLATLSVDIGRAGPAARRSYTQALRNAATRFALYFRRRDADTEDLAYGLLATCVGGMVLARAVEDEDTADAILKACRKAATQLVEVNGKQL
jgi:AcrR family transcriptional regulator